MNSKPRFKLTPLACAITGLAFSASVQAGPFDWGRWGGGFGGNNTGGGGGGCDRGVSTSGCDQEEISRSEGTRRQESTFDEVPEGQWTIYAVNAFGEGTIAEGGEGATGKGSLLVPPLKPTEDGGEGFGQLQLTLNGNYNGTINADGGEGIAFYEDYPDSVTPFIAIDEGGEGFIQGEDGPTSNSSLGFLTFDGGEGDFGAFVAGQPTLFSDMATLQAGNVSAEYGGFTSFTGHDVAFDVNFGPGTFFSSFTEGEFVNDFTANGVINGADFRSTSVGGDATSGFVEGTFFGPNAAALGGRFEVRGEGGEIGDVFAAQKGAAPGGGIRIID